MFLAIFRSQEVPKRITLEEKHKESRRASTRGQRQTAGAARRSCRRGKLGARISRRLTAAHARPHRRSLTAHSAPPPPPPGPGGGLWAAAAAEPNGTWAAPVRPMRDVSHPHPPPRFGPLPLQSDRSASGRFASDCPAPLLTDPVFEQIWKQVGADIVELKDNIFTVKPDLIQLTLT
ncbi:Protein of unknown function, partial [Gryllus bimaculatus]